MRSQIHNVGRILQLYALYKIVRLDAVQAIQGLGYPEDTAIFVMDLLEDPDTVLEAVHELVTPDPVEAFVSEETLEQGVAVLRSVLPALDPGEEAISDQHPHSVRPEDEDPSPAS